MYDVFPGDIVSHSITIERHEDVKTKMFGIRYKVTQDGYQGINPSILINPDNYNEPYYWSNKPPLAMSDKENKKSGYRKSIKPDNHSSENNPNYVGKYYGISLSDPMYGHMVKHLLKMKWKRLKEGSPIKLRGMNGFTVPKLPKDIG